MLDMTTVGIRELKDHLSKYVRQVERGKRVRVTAHGRVVAELVPPGAGAAATTPKPLSRFDQMVADGVIRPPLEVGDPIEDDGWDIRLPPGTVQELGDWDKSEDHEW
jgi:prevent-host-death family protein